MVVGILSLQGATEPHFQKLRALGVATRSVLLPRDLDGLKGIILPGGESTTQLHLLKLQELFSPLARFLSEHPAWGVCAGAILLAEKVTHPEQPSFGVLPVEVARNGYGRQRDSFVVSDLDTCGKMRERVGPKVEGVFIRAPRFTRCDRATVLVEHKGEPVFVEFGHTLASSFHPELSPSPWAHEYFLEKCREGLI